MGTAYRRNWKNIQGKEDITGHDVIAVGSGLLSVAQGAARLADANGVNHYVQSRRARLEGLMANVNDPLASGSIGLELWAAGAVVATGQLDTSNASSLQLLLDKEESNEVTLASGDAVFLLAAIDETLGDAVGNPTVHNLSARIHLALLE